MSFKKLNQKLHRWAIDIDTTVKALLIVKIACDTQSQLSSTTFYKYWKYFLFYLNFRTLFFYAKENIRNCNVE